MATTAWSPNGQITAQVDTIVVTLVPGGGGGTLTITCNGKTIVYTTIVGDTTATAAAAWFALLNNTAAAPAEINEITWGQTGSTITATSGTPGTPFTITATGAAGATLTQTHTTLNSSNSDVNNPANWLRAGVAAIPVNGDDVIVNNSNVPLLWNLQALAAVQFNSFVRWQSFTGTIGLPENNPNGYIEYRPTYFQFSGPPAGTLQMTLGEGVTGSGPTRERYNVGAQLTNLNIFAAGSPQDAYAIRFLGTNANNGIAIVGTSVAVAMLAGESSTANGIIVSGGGSLALGLGASVTSVRATASSVFVNCALTTIVLDGSVLNVQAAGQTYGLLQAIAGSAVNWYTNSALTQLTMTTNSTFNKVAGGTMVLTNATIDGDTCSVNDPYNTITWTNPIVVNNKVVAGPLTFGTGRTVKIT